MSPSIGPRTGEDRRHCVARSTAHGMSSSTSNCTCRSCFQAPGIPPHSRPTNAVRNPRTPRRGHLTLQGTDVVVGTPCRTAGRAHTKPTSLTPFRKSLTCIYFAGWRRRPRLDSQKKDETPICVAESECVYRGGLRCFWRYLLTRVSSAACHPSDTVILIVLARGPNDWQTSIVMALRAARPLQTMPLFHPSGELPFLSIPITLRCVPAVPRDDLTSIQVQTNKNFPLSA